jgi:hypothetical protein
MVSSLAVLKNRGEFSSQHTGDGEVSSAGRVLHHVERSIAVGNGATWVPSSGVEGVTGDGERESVVVREGDEGDMGEIKTIWSALLCSRLPPICPRTLNAEKSLRLASDRVPLI